MLLKPFIDPGTFEETKTEPAFVLGRRGKPIFCAENVGLVLETDPAWRGVLAFDELAGLTMVMLPIPGTKARKSGFRPRPITSADFTAALRWFNRNGWPTATKITIEDAMLAVASENVLSPVKDYLNGLRWDGKPRIDTWLIDYCGAADSPLIRQVGAKWLISAAARALKPGCKADCALVLEGAQGRRKSSVLRALAGEDWFFDGMHDLHGKDASAALRGKWIIELPELSAMRRSDNEAIKAFLSRTEERFRPAYGRTEVVEPRRCVFAGTTNRSDWLTDDTGGRRFWPVEVGLIDTDAVKRDRDQIWAEAVSLFKGGASWWLDRDDEVKAAATVAARSPDDPWTAEVLLSVDGYREVSTRDVLQALGLAVERRDKASAMRVGGILTRAGWVRQGMFSSGDNRGLARYVRPEVRR